MRMTSFIILHYMAFDETVNCIDNLLNIVEGEKKIIVVDNASPNDSGQKLLKKYSSNSDVKIILNENNDGFARGNNIGFQYVKENYNSDFMVFLNNDVEINDSFFIKRLYEIYKKDQFDVLGPDVFCTTLSIHQNPKRLSSYSYDEVKEELLKYQKKCDSKIVVPIKCYLKKIPFLKEKVHSARIDKLNINHDKKYYNIPLHGSCIIFSKEFVQKRNYAFYPKTFMYFETEILDYECHRDGFKEIYDPSLKVLHHHNVSTNSTYNSEIKKVRFMNKCIRDSLNEFIQLIEKNRK